VQRTIAGTLRRYIERLEPREIVNFTLDAFFVDAGLTYNGVPVSVVSGLTHLEGQTVRVVGDGAVVPGTFVVTSGHVTLPAAYSIIHVGLPYVPELETLDLDVSGGSVRDKQKKISSLALLIDKSSRGFLVGPDAAHLTPHKLDPWEPIASESSGQVRQTLLNGYGEKGRIFLRQPDPLPITVLGLIPNVDVGG
jgi:hypothetical protein